MAVVDKVRFCKAEIERAIKLERRSLLCGWEIEKPSPIRPECEHVCLETVYDDKPVVNNVGDVNGDGFEDFVIRLTGVEQNNQRDVPACSHVPGRSYFITPTYGLRFGDASTATKALRDAFKNPSGFSGYLSSGLDITYTANGKEFIPDQTLVEFQGQRYKVGCIENRIDRSAGETTVSVFVELMLVGGGKKKRVSITKLGQKAKILK